MALRLILNGKKAQRAELREAIFSLREQSHDIQVRVTWEDSDVARLITEAHQQGWDNADKKLIISCGDRPIQTALSAPQACHHSAGHHQRF